MLITFLKGYNLLNPISPLCINYGNQIMKMHNKNKADRLQHRCRPCNVVKTIRYGSIFEGSKLSLIDVGIRTKFIHNHELESLEK